MPITWQPVNSQCLSGLNLAGLMVKLTTHHVGLLTGCAEDLSKVQHSMAPACQVASIAAISIRLSTAWLKPLTLLSLQVLLSLLAAQSGSACSVDACDSIMMAMMTIPWSCWWIITAHLLLASVSMLVSYIREASMRKAFLCMLAQE